MRAQHKRILFVCTGNTCRSPMAEGLFRHMARREGGAWEVRSAGVSTSGGSPISRHTSTILSRKGASDKQRSEGLAAETVEWADLILTMTAAHKQSVIYRFPQAVDKVFTLKEFVEDDQRILSVRAERGELESELLVKQMLAERISDRDLQRLAELERQLPDADIQDPFGGSLLDYEACSMEIEAALGKLLEKLNSPSD